MRPLVARGGRGRRRGAAAPFTYTNTANGTTTQWQAGTNWSAAPVSQSDTTLIFGNGAGLVTGDVITSNNDVVSPFSLNALTINYAGTGAGTVFPRVVITGGTLNFVNDGGTGPTLNLNATGTLTTTTPAVNSIPQLQIQSAVSLTNNLTVTGASDALLSGQVSGTGNLIKTGTGMLILGAANNYTGQTLITGGTVSVAHNLGLGATGAGSGTTVSEGGALGLQGGVTVTGETLTLNGNGATVAGALRNISGNNTWAGDIVVGTDDITRVASSSGTLTISGNIALSTEVGDQFVLQGDGAGVISGNISGNGRLTRSVTGSGVWKLSGANTYTGVTTISGGTLLFMKRVSLYNADTSKWTNTNITVANGAVFGLSVGGAGEFTLADIDLLTAVGFSAGGGLGLDTTNAGSGGFLYSSNLTVANVGLVKLGTGVLMVSGNNTYNGVTQVREGTLRLQNVNALGSTVGGTDVQAGGTLEILGGMEIVGETLTIRGDGVGSLGALRSSSGNNIWNGNINATTSVITRIGVDQDSLTIKGNIVGTGTATSGLVFQGNGTAIVEGVISGAGMQLTRSSTGNGLLVLTGANTYTGNTIISNGTIQVGQAGVGSLGATLVQVSGGTLAGTGSTGGLVNLGNNANAFLSPGDASGAGAGTLTLGGGLTLSAAGGGKIKFNLGSSSDLIVINGGTFTGNSSGVTTFQVTPGAGFDNGIYNLIDWTLLAPANVVGVDLADFAVTGLGAGKTGTFQFDVTGKILQLSVVPEPGRAVLLGLGLGMLVFRRGRRPRVGGVRLRRCAG